MEGSGAVVAGLQLAVLLTDGTVVVMLQVVLHNIKHKGSVRRTYQSLGLRFSKGREWFQMVRSIRIMWF